MVNFKPSRDIPDLSGKVILVTGGNTGLGLAAIKQLCTHNPSHIYLAARTKSRADSAIAEIEKSIPDHAPISFLELDLTSFSSIRKAADEFTAKSDRLDVLMNNAGIMATPPGLTKDGYELQFGTNHMGHALLTKLLLPTLLRTAANPEQSKGIVRIVNLSSMGENFAPKGGVKFEALKSPDCEGIGTWARYGQSKLANVLHAKELAKRYPQLTVTAVHPGGVNTELTRGPLASYGGWLEWPTKILSGIFLAGADKGAWGQVWAAVAPLKGEAKEGVQTGTFYFPVGVTGKDSKNALDEGLREKLWKWTEDELEAHTGKA